MSLRAGNATVGAQMRILEIETFGRGGLTHYTFNLSTALADRGHEVTLATAAGFELQGRVDIPPGVRIVEVFARSGYRLESSLPTPVWRLLRKVEAVVDALRITALARRLRPDVIHLHCTNPIALLYLACLRLLSAQLVAPAHTITPHEPIRFQKPIYKKLHNLADLVIAHSKFDSDRLLTEFDVRPERVIEIPHGEYGFFERGGETSDRQTARVTLGLDDQDEVALFFGYIREYKGLDLLLESWPAVAEVRPRARLLIAGDPVQLESERRRELEQWATRVGAVHRFDYIPFSDVSTYFAAADVLVMPYRRISQSGVLYLALSVGLPVVAARVGGLPEMLRDDDNALLVPPESPPELASALGRLLGDATLRKRLKRGGLRLAKEHSWPSIAERTEDAFTWLVGGL
jgi:glycosyltransferase involved in cell wall biosynthesis